MPKPAAERYNRGKQIELLRGVSMASPVLRTARRRNKGGTQLESIYLLCCRGDAPVLVLVPSPGSAGIFSSPPTKGYEALEAYGVPPNLVVGDFDSLGRRPNHPNVVQLPAAKDDTDMVYALRGDWTGDTAGSSFWAAWAVTGAHSGQPPGPGLAHHPGRPGRPGGGGHRGHRPSGTRP